MSESQWRYGQKQVAWCGLLALAVTGFLAPAAQAEVRVSTEIPTVTADSPVPLVDGKLELSVDDAIAIALERNLSLIVQRYNDADAILNLESSFGIYDTLARVQVSSLSETSPSTTDLDGADVSTQEQAGWNLGVTQMVKTGGSFSADFNNTRSESNSVFSNLNPAYRTDLDLAFTQPLLRDFGAEVTERGISVARTNREISRETFAQQVSGGIQQVVNAYWTVVGARNLLMVSERSLELAQQLHEQNKVRVDVGTVAPLELVQSEAGIATREEEIIRNRAAVADSEDSLRQLLNLDIATLWDVEIVTTSEAETERTEVDLGAAIEAGLAHRPEMVSQRLALENLSLDVMYFANQKKPQLDLSARYGVNGIGGDTTNRDFFTGEILSQMEGDYGDALDQIFDGDFEGWRVALNLTYPIQNRTAEAQSAKAEVNLERGQAELRDLELQVMAEIRKAARALETAGQQIDSARVSRRLQQRTLEAEQKRHDNGMSTSYRVLEIQRDLVDAAYREVFAITGYRTALAEFQRTTGSLNDDSGVVIVDTVEMTEGAAPNGE